MTINRRNVKNKYTYISLFSSAGIGCFGFKQQNFECMATAELLEKRINIQKYNQKCKFESGYISGDVTKPEVSNLIFNEIRKWKKEGQVDVVIATPPCQGMSVANQKKSNELKRNSLVVKAIELIKQIKPKIFIFENVFRFLKTICTGLDGNQRTIEEEIKKELIQDFLFSSKIINFKNYGSNSSRTRTLVLGVRKDMLNIVSPFELFPDFEEEKKLKEVIKHYKSLKKFNDFDKHNILHHFKEYNSKMLDWIKDLKEGESAFQNLDPNQRPHKIINNKKVDYVSTFGDKYKRQYWDKVAPCIHTANDCLASQNTIHPKDNRVFSIAELMDLMTIPKNFQWDSIDPNKLKTTKEKLNWILKNQGNIRKCIGEAVPTRIFEKIAIKIKLALNKKDIYQDIKKFELKNFSRERNAAFYTDKINLSYIFNILPNFENKKIITILEPSVGGGNFLLPLFKKYEEKEKVILTLIDIDNKSMNFVKKILNKVNVPKNFEINFVNQDYLKYHANFEVDLIIGNPPFLKIKNNNSNNLFESFWYKSIQFSKNIIFINPKYLLISNLYKNLRKTLFKNITEIIDFGEEGFKGVKIETIALKWVKNVVKNSKVTITSIPKKIYINQERNYIFNETLPYWIIYRNSIYDEIDKKLLKDIFYLHKNYELSNKLLKDKPFQNSVWILKSKNIDFNEAKFVHIKNYDKYVNINDLEKTKFFQKMKNKKNLFLIPTLTYYPRIMKLPKNVFVNGSVIIGELKNSKIKITKKDINYFYSKEFREYYSIAFNHSTRTLNVDETTIKFFGVIRNA